MKCLCVLLALCSLVGVSCCPAQETGDVAAARKQTIYKWVDVKTAKELETRREMLHHFVDVTVDKAAQEVVLQKLVRKPGAKDAAELGVWKKSLHDVYFALRRAEAELEESTTKLECELTSDPVH